MGERKYRKGDLVKIRSLQWWNGQPKNKDGNVVINEQNKDYFPKYIAHSHCGKIGEIIITRGIILPYYVNISPKYDRWFEESWIEGKVELIKINFRELKNKA